MVKEFTKHELIGGVFHQRLTDGYINATEICKACGKLIADYTRLESTKEFLEELSLCMGIPITGLIEQRQGGIPHLQGTYVHPKVAIDVAHWASPKFRVKVTNVVEEWLTGNIPQKTIAQSQYAKRTVMNLGRVPPTHFSVIIELNNSVLQFLEINGLRLPDNAQPDNSLGQYFCKRLREDGFDTRKLPTYKHRHLDGRIVDAKMYPNYLLPLFKETVNEWLNSDGIGHKYFKDRDPESTYLVEQLCNKLIGN